MTQEAFIKQLMDNLDFPFETQEVETIESNCGSTWIELTNGKSYYVSIGQCEMEE